MQCYKTGWTMAVVVGMLLFTSNSGIAEPPIFPTRTAPTRALELKSTAWLELIEREVPELRNAVGDRLPMIMWHGVGFEPLQAHQIDTLRKRGLCQHLQLDAAMIPAALALQDAGMPVILMQGRTDAWPYSLAERKEDWAHQFDADYQPPWQVKENAFEWQGACPHKTAGWQILQQQTRATMQKFRDAGVVVTAVWMDFEGDPYPWSHLFDQLQHCRRCRKELPVEIRENKENWRNFAWQQYVDLYDQHLAAPILEVFPDCLVTNWHVVFSTEDNPVRYFVRDTALPQLTPRFFSATNPIAYGSDLVWHERWSGDREVNQAAVDAFYAEEILQQVRTDRQNRERLGKSTVASIPWVARFCKLQSGDRPAPIMTRERYRETLGELWKQEIRTMQVFNPMHDGFEEFAIIELQDAVLAYDASLRPQNK